MDEVLYTRTSEWMFQQVKDAAGIHFSTFSDPKKSGQTAEQVDAEQEAVAAGAATVRSNHRPDAAWKARHFRKADPNEDRKITILEPR